MLLQIIKKSPLLLCAGALFIFTSCGGSEADSSDTLDEIEAVNEAPRSAPNINGADSQTIQEAKTTDNENAPMNMNAGSENEVKLNPAHGMPGHDCAIAVGQPLNPAPAANMLNTNPNKTVRLNPAHGAPGHDCAVEVGQPLN